MIDGLCATGVEIDLRWVPAHVGIPGNEKADIEAKKATGLKKMRKRNNKVVEADTKYTALPAHGTKPLQKCVRTTLAKSALAEWRREWETETKGRHLRPLVNVPTRDILEIHKGLDKQLSSLVVQMRTGKIVLRKFLYERRVPGVEDKGSTCADKESRPCTAFCQRAEIFKRKEGVHGKKRRKDTRGAILSQSQC